MRAPVYRFLLAGFLWSFGANLVYFFLNFHLGPWAFPARPSAWPRRWSSSPGWPSPGPSPGSSPGWGMCGAWSSPSSSAWAEGSFLGLGLFVFPGLALYGLAGALVQGAAAPLLARLVPEERRVAFFSLQAALTTASGFFSTLLAGYLSDLLGARWVLLFALPFFALAYPLVRGLPRGAGRGSPSASAAGLGLGSASFCPRWSSASGRGSSSPS